MHTGKHRPERYINSAVLIHSCQTTPP
uniref:Uncharacterized protein n=1 Tax=Anguilla anguilla TaxID=7936 RepID=A0A0E9SF54_ANGAN